MHQTDIDLMIKILEEARLCSINQGPPLGKIHSLDEMRIIMDFIDDGMVWGRNWHDKGRGGMPEPLPSMTKLDGIKLKGRRYLQELKDYKRAHSFWSRLEQATWLCVGGALVLVADIAVSFIKLWWHLP